MATPLEVRCKSLVRSNAAASNTTILVRTISFLKNLPYSTCTVVPLFVQLGSSNVYYVLAVIESRCFHRRILPIASE